MSPICKLAPCLHFVLCILLRLTPAWCYLVFGKSLFSSWPHVRWEKKIGTENVKKTFDMTFCLNFWHDEWRQSTAKKKTINTVPHLNFLPTLVVLRNTVMNTFFLTAPMLISFVLLFLQKYSIMSVQTKFTYVYANCITLATFWLVNCTFILHG